MKYCSKCNQKKKLIDFGKDIYTKDGYTYHCKVCRRTWAKQYYLKNKEILNSRSNAWKRRNPQHIKDYKKIYEALHREETLKQHNIRNKKYRGAHVKELTIRRHANKEKDNARRRKRLKSDINYKITYYLRNRLNRAIKNQWKSGSAVRDLGCSIEEFKIYIANKFQEGMNWDNYGEWHLDHIMPLCSFDLTNRTEFLSACYYTNYQPLWALDNMRKGGTIPTL